MIRFMFCCCCLAGLSSVLAQAPAAVPAVVPDLFSYRYEPLLQGREQVSSPGFLGIHAMAALDNSHAMSSWIEQSTLDPSKYRLMVRLTDFSTFFQCDLAGGVPMCVLVPPPQLPALALATLDPLGRRPFSCQLATGETGVPAANETRGHAAWVAWSGEADGKIRVQWMDFSYGAAVSMPLVVEAVPLGYEVERAMGNGKLAWVVCRSPVTGERRGFVLDRRVARAVSVRAIALGAEWTGLDLKMSVREGRCFLTRAVTGEEGKAVQVGVVDGTGELVRNEKRSVLGQWLGTVGTASGTYGYWSLVLPPPFGQLIFQRLLGENGGWVEGAEAEIIATASGGAGSAYITASEEGGLLGAWGAGLFLIQAPAPMRMLGSDAGSASGQGILDQVREGRFYRQTGYPGTPLKLVRTPEDDGAYALRNSTKILTMGYGKLDNPSLSWNEDGPHIVAEVRGYASASASNGPADTALTKKLGGKTELGFSIPGFSTSAHAWQPGAGQCIVYRESHGGGEGSVGDPDDVKGMLIKLLRQGEIQPQQIPFTLGSGAGSQRGVAIAKWREGFLAAWREETSGAATAQTVYSIRAATINSEGLVDPPGGRLVDTSTNELSAVSVSEGGQIVWTRDEVRDNHYFASIQSVFYPRVETPFFFFRTTLSPGDHNASGPKILQHLSQPTVVWRDKRSKAIYASADAGYSSRQVVRVSPEGQLAREPALVALRDGVMGVLWHATGGLWMATLQRKTVSPAVLVLPGVFNENTLEVCGNGAGLIVVAVQKIARGYFQEAEIFQLAPFIPKNGGLNLKPVDGSAMELSWNVSAIFPAEETILETSFDLSRWRAFDQLRTVVATPEKMTLRMSSKGAGRRQYYRLRGVLDGR